MHVENVYCSKDIFWEIYYIFVNIKCYRFCILLAILLSNEKVIPI